jgi:hypothetical protein
MIQVDCEMWLPLILHLKLKLPLQIAFVVAIATDAHEHTESAGIRLFMPKCSSTHGTEKLKLPLQIAFLWLLLMLRNTQKAGVCLFS